jgi:hypothetical protein
VSYGEVELYDAGAPGGVRVKGWAIDPDPTAPLDITVRVGDSRHTIVADLRRDDVASRFPGTGTDPRLRRRRADGTRHRHRVHRFDEQIRQRTCR